VIPPARSLGWGHSILSNFSLSNAAFDERVRAAANAGFDAMGLYVPSYLELRKRDGRTDAELRGRLDGHGISLAEIEVLSGWSRRHPDHAQARHWLETACHMAEVFGARHLVAIGPHDGDFHDAAADLARVCDAAREAGLVVTVEFLPFTNIRTAADAVALAEATGRDNCGITIDVWHHVRGANDWDMLAAVPTERITCVKVSDGARLPEHADYFTDAMNNRRPLGRGEFELDRFFGLLEEKDADVPVSVEVPSAALRSWSADDVAQALHDSLLAYYDG
jgi:sugar phosphate isomerase/epimerase